MTPTELTANEAALVEALRDAEAIFETVAQAWRDRGVEALARHLPDMRALRSRVEMLVEAREHLRGEAQKAVRP